MPDQKASRADQESSEQVNVPDCRGNHDPTLNTRADIEKALPGYPLSP
jgi:hypothetical protein